jgi:hypothetical protein
MATGVTALMAAHRRLNVNTDFISRMTAAERQRMIDLAATSECGLAEKMTFCQKLKRNAYMCESLGEPVSDPVNGRDLAASVFSDTQPSAIESNRDKFCAWQMMNISKNADKLYLSAAAAGSQLAAWGAETAVATLVPHPSRDQAVTTMELHCKQLAVNRMWRDASVVVGAVGVNTATVLDGLDETQRAGVLKILGTPASLLVGVGGAGKSFSVSKIVAGARASDVEVICLAPTHKAKYNIASAVPADITVTTIQSYTQTLKRGEAIESLFVIVDESSMLDIDSLGDFATALIEKVARWQICLVGDEAQLDPVGRGECFRLAVKQAKDVVVRLTKCYRASFVNMFDFHCAVRTGTLPAGDGEVAVVRTFNNDFDVMADLEKVVAAEGESMTYIAWRNHDVETINRLVQAKVTGEPKPGCMFNVGDAVIYVGENKPRHNLTNAMCGRVSNATRYTCDVEWDESCPDGAVATVQTRDLRLAYCLTVHKAQGSGFKRVCVVCTSSGSMLRALDRRWLYTAVSRAQAHVLVLCTNAAKELAAKEPKPAPLSSLNFRKKLAEA